MFQDPLAVSYQQRKKMMFDGKLNTQREKCICLTLYHFFHGSNTIFTSTIGCRNFQTSVYRIPGVLVRTRLSAHVSKPPHFRFLQRGISRSHECEKMFQVLQTLTFAWNNSTTTFALGSSASEHSDVTIRFFESDTRVIERAGFRVHSTWVSGNST